MKVYGCFDDMDIPEGFLTNFAEHKRDQYVAAVDRYGDPDLYIAEHSYQLPGYGGSLWCKQRKDFSEFWRIFEQIGETP